jgi:hypothetical protein
LTVHLERTVVSEKMIEDDMSELSRVQSNSHINWVLALRSVRTRVRRELPSSFLPPTTTKRKKQLNPPKLTTHPVISHPSNPREM